MQMEPTLSPEENQDKLELTGEEKKATSPTKEDVGQENIAQEKTASTSPSTPILAIAIDQLTLE